MIDKRDQLEKSLTDDADRPTVAELKAFGVVLGKTLFSGSVNELFYAASRRHIQITLCTSDTRLKQVPWEYIVWPDVNEGPHARRTFARSVPVSNGEERKAKSISNSLIAVLVIGADVLGRERIPWNETKENLERIIGARMQGLSTARITMELVEGATRKTVRDALEQKPYDIVHFIGHGRPDGIFLRGEGQQRGVVLPTDAFSKMISDAEPALVILSACDTALIKDVQPLGTIAETLVRSGVPAVVANQLPISVSSIADFTGALYRSLLTDGNIDVAVNKGRIALVKEMEGLRSAPIEWGIPVLYRRPGCSQLFTP
ncbi:CHAT domain-containing protein [Bradyrhizobium sp. LTSP857]|uniref:CHAT domain-containing protein n=1 Tax=Bradyrhizobium sp. LTSP857 TaxID=1619231 RepID=UPI0018CD392D|nr:CHAT domain-containing protein [Bradyrhizobium sp. LTSP857]